MGNWRARAPKRKRPRRIQKKIDKREGMLHFGYYRRYNMGIRAMASALRPFMDEWVDIMKERIGIEREVMDIVKDATARQAEADHA